MLFAKLLKYIAVGLGACLVMLLLAGIIWIQITNARLERRLADLRAGGQPTSLADLRPEPVAPEQNAVTYLRQAEADLMAIQAEIVAEEEKAAEEQAQKEQERENEGQEGETPEPAEDVVPESVLAATRAAVAARPGVLALLKKAADCPAYAVNDPTGGIDPMVDPAGADQAMVDRINGPPRAAARLLAKYWFACLMAQGKRDEAVGCCITTLKLARHYEHEPTLIAFLVSAACRGMAINAANRALQTGPVSEGARKALDDELARHDVYKAYHQTLATERAYGLDQFDAMAGGMGALRAIRGREMLCYLDGMEACLDRAAQLAEGKSLGLMPPLKGIYAQLMIPGVEATETAAMRTEATINALRVLLALQRRAQPDAPAPADLAELGLPARATQDPFTGKPLVVKWVEGGWLIYSVNFDLTDDGGDFDDNKDAGIGPPEEAKKEKEPAGEM
ncbi:MAG: hypothetical protein JW809_16715 [Pirellulales bacterium]|nr:hypothetical protein [Pirellulales bacterium]